MKSRWVVLGVSVSALAVAQSAFRYSDQAGTLLVNAKNALFTQVPGPVYKFTLTGAVTVDSKDDGVKMSAPRIDMELVPVKGNSKKTEIRKAVAKGAVEVTKTTPFETSRLTGSSGDYTKQGADGVLKMAGPVTIKTLDAVKQTTLDAKGDAVTAIIDSNKSAKQGLKTATLTGKVTLVGTQAPVGKDDGGTVVATGSKLVLNRTVKPATATLTGNVTIEGRGPGSFGVIRGVGKAVLTLDDKGRVNGISTEGG